VILLLTIARKRRNSIEAFQCLLWLAPSFSLWIAYASTHMKTFVANLKLRADAIFTYQASLLYEIICYLKAQDGSETWKWIYPREEKSECLVLNSCFQEGGPIGLVENGDIITIDIQKRRMDVELTEEQFVERRKKWSPPSYKATRGVLYKVRKTYCDPLSKILHSLLIVSQKQIVIAPCSISRTCNQRQGGVSLMSRERL